MMKTQIPFLRFIRENPILSKLEIHYHFGRLDKPVFILVHGHGVSKKSWITPLKMSIGNSTRDPLAFIRFTTKEVQDAKALKKTLPQGNFFFTTVQRAEHRDELRSFWQILAEKGYSIFTWNQRYPNGSIRYGLEELEAIFRMVSSQPFTRDIIFLCHSRGGLLARTFFQSMPPLIEKVKGLIMLGTPNHGSMLATFAEKFSRFRILPHFFLLARRFFPSYFQDKRVVQELMNYIGRWIDFLKSDAVSELKFNSPFIMSLKQGESVEKRLNIPYHHIVGTRSQYDKIYFSPEDGDFIIEIPFMYEKIPDLLLPWELVEGKGDGLVAVYRARLGFEKSFEEKNVNHSELLVDREIQKRVLEIVESF